MSIATDDDKDGKELIYRAISDIVGGVPISDRLIGDSVTINDIHDTYRRYTGAAIIIDSPVFTAFKHGFTDEIDDDDKLELMKAVIWAEEFGYSAVYHKDGALKALNPLVDTQGFKFRAFDQFGRPALIDQMWNANTRNEVFFTYKAHGIIVTDEEASAIEIVDRENPDAGFFPLRAFRGLNGPRGISRMLNLVDIIRGGNKLYVEYVKHGEHQAISHPVLKLQDFTPERKAQAEADMRAPRKDRMLTISMEDEFRYDGPMKGSNAWDPSFMLEYGDKYLARESSMKLSQLTGDPMGYLSASDVTRGEFWDAVKLMQMIYLVQLRPILVALGASEKVAFQDPESPNFMQKLEGIKLTVEALGELIKPEQLVDIINDEFGFEGDKRLELNPEYQKLKEEKEDNQDADKPDEPKPASE